MKIAWYTPFNIASAIGGIGAYITQELARRGHEVEIVRTEINASKTQHQTDLPVHWWRDIVPATLKDRFDLVVVNIGDHYNFHGGMFSAIDTRACLGIFHDFFLYNLFCGWLADNNGARAKRHDKEIEETYGQSTLAKAIAARNGEATLGDIARDFPMTEWIASRCAGALSHAEFYAGRLRAACPGPVGVVHLTRKERDVPPLGIRNRDHVVAVTVGILNPNKCADKIIEAIGQSEVLREKVYYRLVGQVENGERARLQEIAQKYNYLKLIIVGAVDEAALDQEITNADICCCLRRPVLEGASGSAIEALLAGRPTVVADAGFYSELPNNLVFKVPPDIDIQALTKTLERLVNDEPLRRKTGTAARLWAIDHFSVKRYVDAFEILALETMEAGPLLGLAATIGRELVNLGLSPADAVVDRLAQASQMLFEPDLPASPAGT